VRNSCAKEDLCASLSSAVVRFTNLLPRLCAKTESMVEYRGEIAVSISLTHSLLRMMTCEDLLMEMKDPYDIMTIDPKSENRDSEPAIVEPKTSQVDTKSLTIHCLLLPDPPDPPSTLT
jgi:hypothetical protein